VFYFLIIARSERTGQLCPETTEYDRNCIRSVENVFTGRFRRRGINQYLVTNFGKIDFWFIFFVYVAYIRRNMVEILRQTSAVRN